MTSLGPEPTAFDRRGAVEGVELGRPCVGRGVRAKRAVWRGGGAVRAREIPCTVRLPAGDGAPTWAWYEAAIVGRRENGEGFVDSRKGVGEVMLLLAQSSRTLIFCL